MLFSCGDPTRTDDLQVMSLASYQLLHSAMYDWHRFLFASAKVVTFFLLTKSFRLFFLEKMGILRFWTGYGRRILSIFHLKNSIFVKIFRISRGRESRIFIYEKNVLLQRTYEWVEYATICAYFYTSPTSRLHICINMQLGLQIWGFEVKKKSQDFVEKSQGFIEILRRLVEKTLDLVQTKSYFLHTRSILTSTKSNQRVTKPFF